MREQMASFFSKFFRHEFETQSVAAIPSRLDLLCPHGIDSNGFVSEGGVVQRSRKMRGLAGASPAAIRGNWCNRIRFFHARR
jgi:hypothetical protein